MAKEVKIYPWAFQEIYDMKKLILSVERVKDSRQFSLLRINVCCINSHDFRRYWSPENFTFSLLGQYYCKQKFYNKCRADISNFSVIFLEPVWIKYKIGIDGQLLFIQFVQMGLIGWITKAVCSRWQLLHQKQMLWNNADS